MSKQTDFISKMAPLVQAERKKRDKWVLPSVCIAQAILETGWGASSLMSKANAYFGIKATKRWKGKVYSSKTKECYDGINFTTETACFRAYDSLADSVADYFDLICKSSRYKAAVNNSDAKATITAIKNGGYATDPDYASKIMNLINTYDLIQYDFIEPTELTKGCGYMFEPLTVKKGCEGASVLLMQTILKGKGYKGKDGKPLKLDADCGTNSEYAINSYQTARRKAGVEIGTNGKNDSTCGSKMWADLIGL